MLTAKEIKSIITSGEGYNAEFKVRAPSKLRELAEEICAFANAAGGVLILGVRDDNQIVGVELDNRNLSAIQNALSEINPPVFADVYKVEVDEKKLWIIEVNSGEQKPYVLSGAIFVRQGANSQKLTSVEQMRYFFQQAERIYFDEGPCVAFDVENDLELIWFEEFRMEANLTKAVTQNQIIQNLRLLTANGIMKNGGVLFFGKHPEDFIDTAVIRCVAFEGITKTQIFDDKVFTGPLVMQYEQAMQWLKGKLNVRYEIEGGGPRKEHWEIPETAFREAIVNALAHRDYYDKGAKITIELFDDRVEISNPGGLTSAIKPEEFGKRSHSRNPLIFGLFARIRLVEQIGSGIGRIQSAMKIARLPIPEFKTQGLFTVIFQRSNSLKATVEEVVRTTVEEMEDTVEETVEEMESTVEETVEEVENTVEETEEIILNAIRNHSKITAKELMLRTGLSRRGVEYQLDKLKKNNRVQRIGTNKGGKWKVIEKEYPLGYTVEESVIFAAEEKAEEPVVEIVGATGNIIVNAIRKNSKITAKELMVCTGLSRRGVEYQLDKLKRKNFIERVGPNKGGEWRLIRKDFLLD